MAYNTRRKSISLTALGIQIPQTSRVHRPSISKATADADHPAKRIKREHSPEVSTESTTSSTTPTKTVTFADRPVSSGRNAYEHTPPPSPGATKNKIDFAGINDDIVAGVIEQLDKTGNRPHLIKDLASVLSTTNSDVSRSANPAALLSSRLASYMRRTWSTSSPCPVAKELIPVHPRKVFYYLTTSQRQELPASALEPFVPSVAGRGKSGSARVITPSLSNASQDDDFVCNNEERKRAAMSPSPEVELGFDMDELAYSTSPDSAPEFPTPPTNGPSSFTGSITRRQSSDEERNSRCSSGPALEGDEQEFSATARDMRMKGLESSSFEETPVIKVDKTVESIEGDDMKVDFGEDATTLSLSQNATPGQAQKHEAMMMSSPLVKADAFGRPGTAQLDSTMLGEGLVWSWDIRRPQSVGLDELEDMFDHY